MPFHLTCIWFIHPVLCYHYNREIGWSYSLRLVLIYHSVLLRFLHLLYPIGRFLINLSFKYYKAINSRILPSILQVPLLITFSVMLLLQSCQYAYFFSSVNWKPLIVSALYFYHPQKALGSRASTNPLAPSAFSLGYKTRMFACFPHLHPWDGHSLGWHRLVSVFYNEKACMFNFIIWEKISGPIFQNISLISFPSVQMKVSFKPFVFTWDLVIE